MKKVIPLAEIPKPAIRRSSRDWIDYFTAIPEGYGLEEIEIPKSTVRSALRLCESRGLLPKGEFAVVQREGVNYVVHYPRDSAAS